MAPNSDQNIDWKFLLSEYEKTINKISADNKELVTKNQKLISEKEKEIKGIGFSKEIEGLVVGMVAGALLFQALSIFTYDSVTRTTIVGFIGILIYMFLGRR